MIAIIAIIICSGCLLIIFCWKFESICSYFEENKASKLHHIRSKSDHIEENDTTSKKDQHGQFVTETAMPPSWYKYHKDVEEIGHARPAQICVDNNVESVLSELSPVQTIENQRDVFKKPQKQNKKRSVHRMRSREFVEYKHVENELNEDDDHEDGIESLSSSKTDSSSSSDSDHSSSSLSDTSSDDDDDEKDGENTTTAFNVDDMVGNMVMLMSKPVDAGNQQ